MHGETVGVFAKHEELPSCGFPETPREGLLDYCTRGLEKDFHVTPNGIINQETEDLTRLEERMGGV